MLETCPALPLYPLLPLRSVALAVAQTAFSSEPSRKRKREEAADSYNKRLRDMYGNKQQVTIVDLHMYKVCVLCSIRASPE